MGNQKYYLNTNIGPVGVSAVTKRKLYVSLELLILEVIFLNLNFSLKA